MPVPFLCKALFIGDLTAEFLTIQFFQQAIQKGTWAPGESAVSVLVHSLLLPRTEWGAGSNTAL